MLNNNEDFYELEKYYEKLTWHSILGAGAGALAKGFAIFASVKSFSWSPS